MREHDTPTGARYPHPDDLDSAMSRARDALAALERIRWRVSAAVDAGVAPSWQEIGMVAVHAEDWRTKADELADEAQQLRGLVVAMDSVRLEAERAA